MGHNPRNLSYRCPWPMLPSMIGIVVFLKKSESNVDACEDIYRGHELFLNNIRIEKPRAYHRLMADLYNEVANAQGAHSAQVVANNAMSILDLSGMDE
ncbi:hypothetical protein C0993_000282 [Termitomyces sp. T159_Od127]|nr:hypothetical protein C0993_000282 [Termitomyces sp. T159_Od127]